jgi:acyl carrier protein
MWREGARARDDANQTPAQPAAPSGAQSGESRMSSTEQIIFDIIAKTCSVERGRITLDSTLKDLDVHSLDAVQVLFEIEDRFDVSVPEREDQYSAGTVRDLIEGVERLLAAKATAA